MLESKKEHEVRQRTPFLEFQEVPTSKSAASNTQNAKTTKARNHKDKTIVLNTQLQNALRVQVHTLQGTSDSEEVVSSLSSQDGISAETMMARNIELQKPMESIWKRIRANINYHSDFYVNNIQGVVRAEILVTPGGRLQALTSIEGQKDLVEWVKTALYRALSAEFLKIHMSKKALLNLFFRFVILPYPAPVQEFVFAQTQLNFDILGYKDFETGKATDLYNSIKGTQASRISEWNFSKQLEPYRDSCLFRRHLMGCEIALEMITKMGLHQDAIEIQQQIKYLSNKNTTTEPD